MISSTVTDTIRKLPLKKPLKAVTDLIRQGKILYWGTSEWTAGQISRAIRICADRNWPAPVINQPNYSLVNRNIEHSILPVCEDLGMGTANFSPLAQGILTGKYSGGKIPAGSRASNENLSMFMRGMVSDRDLLDRVDQLKAVADGYGLTTAQLSLAWILSHPGISSVIIGASTVEQLESNVKASGVRLKPEDMAQIESLFPLS